MSNTQITITKMDRAEHAGDWHDKPLRWKVNGPAAEVQKFSTKKDAGIYASIRRKSPDFKTACNAFVQTA